MDKCKYPYRGMDLMGISNVFIAEYNALRRELEIFLEHQKDIMNFSVLVFTAILGLFGILRTQIENEDIFRPASYVFLLFPWIFYLLALLYADKTVRILRIADYLQNHLRKRIIRISGELFWQWELYKMHESFPLKSRNLALLFDRTRWLIFMGPSVMSIILFFGLYYDVKISSYRNIVNLSNDIIAILLLATNAVAIMLIWKFVIPRLQETMGVESRKDVVDLDTYDTNDTNWIGYFDLVMRTSPPCDE